MKYNADGGEIMDDTPIEVPVRFRGNHQQSIYELHEMMMRLEEDRRRMMGIESVEEERDFELDDDPDISETPSRYELDDIVEQDVLTFHRNAETIRARQKGDAKPKESKDVQQSGTAGDSGKSADPGKAGDSGGDERKV